MNNLYLFIFKLLNSPSGFPSAMEEYIGDWVESSNCPSLNSVSFMSVS